MQERNVFQDQQHFLEKLTGMSSGLVSLFDVIEQRTLYIKARSPDLLGYAPEIVLTIVTPCFKEGDSVELYLPSFHRLLTLFHEVLRCCCTALK